VGPSAGEDFQIEFAQDLPVGIHVDGDDLPAVNSNSNTTRGP